MNEQAGNALFSEAMAAISAKRLDDAEKLLQQVVRADPGRADAWYWLAQVTADFQLTIACLKKVLQIDPAHEAARRLLDLSQQEERGTEPPAGEAPKHDRPVPPLGDYLVAMKLITAEQLEAALALQRQAALQGVEQKLGAILVQHRFISQHQLDMAVDEQHRDYYTLFWD